MPPATAPIRSGHQVYDAGNYSGDYSLESFRDGYIAACPGKQDGGICLTCLAKKSLAALSDPVNSVGGASSADPINVATGMSMKR